MCLSLISQPNLWVSKLSYNQKNNKTSIHRCIYEFVLISIFLHLLTWGFHWEVLHSCIPSKHKVGPLADRPRKTDRSCFHSKNAWPLAVSVFFGWLVWVGELLQRMCCFFGGKNYLFEKKVSGPDLNHFTQLKTETQAKMEQGPAVPTTWNSQKS